MADPGQIEQEIREYLDKEENLRRSDKYQYLMAIVNKHFAIDKTEHFVNYSDFNSIVGDAKTAWPKTIVPLFLSRKEVRNSDTNHVLIIEAFLNYLNRNKLLKRLVKFDYLK